jgi:protein deglycase
VKILTLLAEGFEETEAVTLIDILRRAGYDVVTASITGSLQVTGGHGITLTADTLFSGNMQGDIDMLLLPGGGPGVNNLAASSKVIELVRQYRTEKKYIAAICAAPFVLEKAGVIKGVRVTAFPTWQVKLESAIVTDEPVVMDGKIITGRGVGAAIDMALKIVEVASGKEKREEIARSIVFN